MLSRVIVFAIVVGMFSSFAFAQKSDLTAQIKLMDKQWIIEAYFSRDLKDFDRIVAEDFLITAANGKVLTKAEKRANVARDYTDEATRSQSGYIFDIDTDSHRVRLFNNTAVSNGFIVENYAWKTQKINNRVHFTNTYVKRNGRWQVVASQFTNVKLS